LNRFGYHDVMTLEILETRVAQAVDRATNEAEKCSELIVGGNLGLALEHCRKMGIEPPQCSLEATSEYAIRLRSSAGRKLSDPKWWDKALEKQATRNYENDQFAQGKVTNYVSDGLAEYMRKHKK
jgi:hypothetical protein